MGGNMEFERDGEKFTADQIDFNKISLTRFRGEMTLLFSQIETLFMKKFNLALWNGDDLMGGKLYNGSASFVMDVKNDPDMITKIKPTMGDIDIMIPRENGENLFNLLEEYVDKPFNPNVKYLGSSKTLSSIGNTLICLFEVTVKDEIVKVQVDFELVDFIDGHPTEWGSFSHNSSLEDTQRGIKAVFHKYLIQAIIGARTTMYDVIQVTPSATRDNWKKKIVKGKKALTPPRYLKFSVSKGVGVAYERIAMDGYTPVYKELLTKDREYHTDLDTIFFATFFNADYEQYKEKFKSFIGVCDLMKSHLKDKEIEISVERFLYKLWGTNEQTLHKDPIEDRRLKNIAATYLLNTLELNIDSFKQHVDLEEIYYKNFKSF